jgi:hypothetical protein
VCYHVLIQLLLLQLLLLLLLLLLLNALSNPAAVCKSQMRQPVLSASGQQQQQQQQVRLAAVAAEATAVLWLCLQVVTSAVSSLSRSCLGCGQQNTAEQCRRVPVTATAATATHNSSSSRVRMRGGVGGPMACCQSCSQLCRC